MVLKVYFRCLQLQKARFCSNKAINKNKLYSSTIILPQTKFPLRLNNKQIVERDQKINSVSNFCLLMNYNLI